MSSLGGPKGSDENSAAYGWRYEHTLSCGHKVVLGVVVLRRDPEGAAWCNECQRYLTSGEVRRVAVAA